MNVYQLYEPLISPTLLSIALRNDSGYRLRSPGWLRHRNSNGLNVNKSSRLPKAHEKLDI